MSSEEMFVMVVMTLIASGVLIIVLGLRQRAHQLELAHRERMAMIEKGVVPSPETDPGHPAWKSHHPQQVRGPVLHDVSAAQRSMTLGIVIVAIGLGFMSIIGVAADAPPVALGIGGAIAIVGIAFIVIAQVRRTAAEQLYTPGGHQSYKPPPVPSPHQYSGSDRPIEPPPADRN